jgi:uncharacterized damage-inducible protein DinB
MTGKDALNLMLHSTLGITTMLLKDLSDADLQHPPVPGANNIAWQLGHLIDAETQIGGMLNIPYPELPASVKGLGKTETTKTRADGGKLAKADYIALLTKVRQATIAGLAKLPDSELDKPNTGPMKEMAPTMGSFLVLAANHTLMHAGQFSVLRRALNKPIAI